MTMNHSAIEAGDWWWYRKRSLPPQNINRPQDAREAGSTSQCGKRSHLSAKTIVAESAMARVIVPVEGPDGSDSGGISNINLRKYPSEKETNV